MLVDACGKSFAYRPSLCRRGNDAEEVRRADEHRDGESDRVFRNVLDLCEASVVDLLIAADLVELYGLDKLFVIKIGNGRIIKGDMSVMFKNHAKFVTDREKTLRAEILKDTPAPPAGNGGKSVTKDDFSKLTLTEKAKFAQENPEQYKEFYGGN